MPIEEVFALLRGRPFEPFTVHLADGTSYEIRHPDQLIPTGRTLFIGVPGQPGSLPYDRVDRVALVHVTRLEPLGSPHGQG